MFKRRILAASGLLASLVPLMLAGSLGVGCADKGATAIVIAVSTEGAIPDDINRLRIVVKRGSNAPTLEPYELPVKARLPGTITLRPIDTEKLDGPLKVSVEGYFAAPSGEEKKRVLRSATLSFVSEKQKLLRMPLRFACFDSDDCDDGKTCIGGECVADTRDAGALPDFEERMVQATGAGCFDERKCLGAGTAQVTLPSGSCSFDAPGQAGTFNLAMEWAVAPGSAVLLEQDPGEGYTLDGAKVTLAPGLCKALQNKRAVAVYASTSCPAKTPEQSLCEVPVGPLPQNITANAWNIDGPGGSKIQGDPKAASDLSALKIELDNGTAPPLPPNFAFRGKIFSFLPHGYSFAQPVTVRVPYEMIAQSGPVLITAPPSGTWAAVPGAKDDNGALVASVDHFSYFVVVEDISGAGGAGGQGGAGGSSGASGQGGIGGSSGTSGQGGEGGAAGQGGIGGGAGQGGADPGCSHDLCMIGEALDPSCDPCVEQICADPAGQECCSNSWGSNCTSLVLDFCADACNASGGASGSGGSGGGCATDYGTCNDFDLCQAHPGQTPPQNCASDTFAICSSQSSCCNGEWGVTCAAGAQSEWGYCTAVPEAELVTTLGSDPFAPFAVDPSNPGRAFVPVSGSLIREVVPDCGPFLQPVNEQNPIPDLRALFFDGETGGRLFWFDFGGNLRQCSLIAGCVAEPFGGIPSSQYVRGMTVVGPTLVLGTEDDIGKYRVDVCPLPSCDSKIGVEVSSLPRSMAVAGGYLFWSSTNLDNQGSSVLHSCPFDGAMGCFTPGGSATTGTFPILSMASLNGRLFAVIKNPNSGLSELSEFLCTNGVSCVKQAPIVSEETILRLVADEANGFLYFSNGARIYRFTP